MRHKELIEKAISIVGTQRLLAEKAGLTQQGISYMLNSATQVSAEAAIAIERATDGQVGRHELRPDLYPADSEQRASA